MVEDAIEERCCPLHSIMLYWLSKMPGGLKMFLAHDVNYSI